MPSAFYQKVLSKNELMLAILKQITLKNNYTRVMFLNSRFNMSLPTHYLYEYWVGGTILYLVQGEGWSLKLKKLFLFSLKFQILPFYFCQVATALHVCKHVQDKYLRTLAFICHHELDCIFKAQNTEKT